MTQRTFLITGAGRGLGLAFTEAALAVGHQVVGTVRDKQAGDRFEALAPGRAHAFVLDVADHAKVPEVVAAIEAEVGAIDVLINSAGYGYEGVLEESPLDALVRQFDVNVFGSVALIKAVLPGMRQRRRGHIINLSSFAGHVPLPGIAYYAASKFSIEAISAVLAQEVREFGVRVTALAPGAFRTDWAGSSLVRSERSIADYDALFEPIREARRTKSGHQTGDPAKAAQAVLAIIEADDPPVHLVLGKDALKQVRDRSRRLLAELDTWEALSLSTEYE
jgi:NAD(P)-dependent dehydrogenase (short-subunit alcohol dehydrogenase family)